MDFEAWTAAVFGQPPKRDFDEDDVPHGAKLAPAKMLAHLTQLFSNGPNSLESFPQNSVAQGLFVVLREDDWSDVTLDTGLPEAERIQCIRAMLPFFRDYLAGDLSDEEELRSVRYMWWDLFRTWGSPGDESMAATDDALLSTMTSIVALDCEGCQESALHGLNHWQSGYPGRVVSVIDSFLKRGCSAELTRTAEAAKLGHIQ